MLPLDELNNLGSQVENATDLDVLRPIFDRMTAIARENPDDFEVVLTVDRVRQQIVDRGLALRAQPPRASPRVEPPPPPVVPSEELWSASTLDTAAPAAPADDLFHDAPQATAAPPPPVVPAVPPPPVQRPPVAKPPATAANRRRTLMMGGGLGAAALLVAIVVVVLVTRKSPAPPAAATVPVDIATVPAGATVQINGEARCKSNCRVDLAPGSYQVTALLDGFETGASSIAVAAGKPAAVSLNLTAQQTSLRLLADLDSGTVEVDGQPAGAILDGQFALDHVAPGKHSVRVTGKSAQVSFSFESEGGRAPVITQPVVAKNMLAVLVASLGSNARVYSSSPAPVKVALNDQPQGEAGPQGLELKNVPMGDQNLTVGEGQNQHPLVVSLLPAPAISAFLKSDVNTGTLVVSTVEDDVTVFLNGKEYRRKTKRGSLRVQTLGNVVVRVAKPGFQQEPDQTATIKKGDETKVVFNLKPLPKFAALQVHNGVPGTQIILEDQALGRVGPDGTFAAANVAPGEHAIEARREGFVARRIQRTLKAGETLVINGADIALTAATGSLHVVTTPPEATVLYRRTSESQLHVARESTLKLEPGAYVFVARAPGFVEGSTQTTVAAGETRSVEIALARERVAEVVKPKPAVSWAGWTKEGDEYVRKGGNRVVLCSGPFTGTIAFTAHLRKAGGVFRGGKLRWFIEDSAGSTQFEADKKRFQAKGPAGSRSEEHARERAGEDERTYTFEIDILPDRIVHRMKAGNAWVTVDDFTAKWGATGKFGLVIPGSDEIGISGLRLTPK